MKPLFLRQLLLFHLTCDYEYRVKYSSYKIIYFLFRYRTRTWLKYIYLTSNIKIYHGSEYTK